ncbi:HEAT repeat domain-containing protein [Haloarcula nitratireducens]|uniref:HEAT repeat domain-containing protein n=1 Tax=Haloarcula nitratireducens TaxID=2487749 RepID=A0AAW4P6E3_9EURY|nr:HEAT repeat domain-containing protein [Halomicroarcula nitratireducens]MBX0293344.1 HEAT repeat domain-containing protein [Halomicroarcula nitratireducens]
MRDEEEATDGPTDPRVHPEESPGFGVDPDGLEDIEVDRDVTIGEATPRELQATDIRPVADDSVEEKIAALAEGDVVERRRVALALGEESASEGLLDALIGVGLTDDDADVRQFAVESLGNLGGERAGVAAVETLEDENPWVRAEALVALDRIDRAAFEPHIEAALGDDHHAVRRNAAVSLFKLRGEDTLGILLEQSRDKSERVREWAAHLLAGVDDDRAEARLTELASDDAEPAVVRSTAARSLEADPGKFRRQFTGGTEKDSAQLPGESRLNRRPDL